MDLNRRQFLKTGVAGLSALALGPIPKARAWMRLAWGGNGRSTVIINLAGGYDGLNIVVPHTVAEYYTRRPTIAVPAVSTLPVSPTEGFNPAFGELHTHWLAGRMNVIRQVGYPTPDLSHFNSTDIWSTGSRLGYSAATRSGWMSRMAVLNGFTDAIEIVGIGTGNRLDFTGTTFKPAVFTSLAAFNYPVDAAFTADSNLRNQIHRTGLQTPLLLTDGSLEKKIHDKYQSTSALIDIIRNAIQTYPALVTYPNTSLGRTLQDVARLMYANLGTKIFYVQQGGFDHHAAEGTALPNLLTQVSQAVDAFIRDLIAMNLYDRVTTLMLSEFGRRNYENASFGTDHGHGNHMFGIGAGVRAGMKGQEVRSIDVQADYLSSKLDFRIPLKDLMEQWLGLNMQGIFTELSPGSSEETGSAFFHG